MRQHITAINQSATQRNIGQTLHHSKLKLSFNKIFLITGATNILLEDFTELEMKREKDVCLNHFICYNFHPKLPRKATLNCAKQTRSKRERSCAIFNNV